MCVVKGFTSLSSHILHIQAICQPPVWISLPAYTPPTRLFPHPPGLPSHPHGHLQVYVCPWVMWWALFGISLLGVHGSGEELLRCVRPTLKMLQGLTTEQRERWGEGLVGVAPHHHGFQLSWGSVVKSLSFLCDCVQEVLSVWTCSMMSSVLFLCIHILCVHGDNIHSTIWTSLRCWVYMYGLCRGTEMGVLLLIDTNQYPYIESTGYQHQKHAGRCTW